jgi:hypothetical protein
MTKIDGSHHEVKVSPLERKMIRLWIDSGAAYPGTYAALGTGMTGSDTQGQLADPSWVDRAALLESLRRRCGECHMKDMGLPDLAALAEDVKRGREKRKFAPRGQFSAHLLYNFSRPERSLVLLAPLAREAGGYGLCKGVFAPKAGMPASLKAGWPALPWGKNIGKKGDGKPRTESVRGKDVFLSKDDADYQTILAAMRDSQKKLEEIKRFDMPGFHPISHYVREMKRYGVLPADLPADAPIDVYATDRAYWQSLWYKPPGS